MLNNLTIREKLLAGFAAMLLLTLAIALIGIFQMGNIKADLDDIMKDRYPKTVLSHEIIKHTLDNGRLIRNAILHSDPALIEKTIQEIEASRKINGEFLNKMESLLSTPKGKELFAAITAARARFSSNYEKIYPLIRANNDEKSLAFLLSEFAPSNNAYMASLEAMSNFQSSMMEKGYDDSLTAYASARSMMFVFLAGGLVLGAFTALLLSGQISAQLSRVVRQSEKIADGDFTVNEGDSLPARTEIGRLMLSQESMRIKLIDALNEVRDRAVQVNDSARELASVSEQVAISVQRQADSTASASATLEQLSVSIDHVSDNAVDASRQASHAGDLAQQSNKDVVESGHRIQEVNDAVLETAAEMDKLTHEVQEIGNIVTVIREVADQTNLLALNAAIEAARAGESGRGFAVVADEVRKLAERTTKSAQEITRMINSIQQNAEHVVESMEGSRQRVGGMTEGANRTSAAIQDVQLSATDVVGSIGNINTALSEQRTASQELANSMESVAQMAEENSATVEELATTSHVLMDLSNDLKQVVARFRW